jgi:hypothetical protein
MSDDKIVVMERWTADGGWRKVGNQPWEPIDLRLYGGKLPFVIFDFVRREAWRKLGWG